MKVLIDRIDSYFLVDGEVTGITKDIYKEEDKAEELVLKEVRKHLQAYEIESIGKIRWIYEKGVLKFSCVVPKA